MISAPAKFRLPATWSTAGLGAVLGEIFLLLLAAVFLGHLMQRLHHANLSILFLLVVLITAVRHGLWPSIASSFLGFLAFNFFFTTPYRTFVVTEEGDIATLIFFLLIAILSGDLGSRLRNAITRRDEALDRISNLYEFSNALTVATDRRSILKALVDHLSTTLGAQVIIRRDDGGERRTLAESQESGSGGTLPGEWTSINIRLDDEHDAVLSIQRTHLTSGQRDLVRTLVGQVGIAMDRVTLADNLETSRRESERARLRSALLTSVSHDLRTPLAAIIGASSSLRDYGDDIDSDNRRDLSDTVLQEAERLNGYIQNLLDMTRIEHGELKIEADWEDMADLLGSCIRRIRKHWPDADIRTRFAGPTRMGFVQGALFQQAIYNVLDNAMRHGDADGPVEVDCRISDGELIVEIADSGPGLADRQLVRIFDMFYRSEAGDSRTDGTGLGLAITRGIVEAHGGSVIAEHGQNGRGLKIRLRVPQPSRPDGDPEP